MSFWVNAVTPCVGDSRFLSSADVITYVSLGNVNQHIGTQQFSTWMMMMVMMMMIMMMMMMMKEVVVVVVSTVVMMMMIMTPTLVGWLLNVPATS